MTMKKLYIVPDGGLANRMRAITGGIVLAQKTGREAIIVWNRRMLCNADYTDLFKTTFVNEHIIRPNKLKFVLTFEEPRKKNLFTSILYQNLRFSKVYSDSRNIEPYLGSGEKLISEILKIKGDVMIFSGLHFCDYPIELYREIFKPSDDVEHRVTEILNKQRPLVACQIRRTDHIEAIKYSPLSCFVGVMDKWVAENPGEKFYLATDDQSIKMNFHRRYGESVIYNPIKARRDTVEGIIDGYAEMVIMARCSLIYGSVWSSYCESASQLSGNKLIRIGNQPD